MTQTEDLDSQDSPSPPRRLQPVALNLRPAPLAPTPDFERAEFLELLRQVGSIAHIGVWELDLATMRPRWSPEIYRIHEVEEGTPISLEHAITFYEPEARQAISDAVDTALKYGHSYDLQLPMVTARGRKIWVRALGSAEFLDGRCIRLFGAFQDITCQRQAEEQALEFERKVIRGQKMEAIGTVAGGVAHEFNNILGGVMGALELMKIRFGAPGSELQRYLDSSLDGCRRAAKIIREMLSFSREECRERVVADLRRLVREAYPLLRAGTPSGIELVVNAVGDPMLFLGDRTQLYQVLVNLVSNSTQSLLTLRGRIEVSVSGAEISQHTQNRPAQIDDGSYVVLTVKDNGCGIPRNVMDRIFDPFFTTKPVGEGTGLGLSVVHGIVRAHGGVIDVKSEVGVGSTFTVYLSRVDGRDLSEEAPRDTMLPRVGRGQRILVVDDEVALGNVTGQLLALSGYEPSVVSDPRNALEMLRGAPEGFDCLLIDYSMPHITGPELIGRARAFGVTCPVLLTTGLHDEQLGQAIADLGIHEILKKPMPAGQIMEALSRALAV